MMDIFLISLGQKAGSLLKCFKVNKYQMRGEKKVYLGK